MPADVRYDQQKHVLYVTVRGAPTIAEFQSAMDTVTGSKEYPPNVATLYDFRDANLNGLSRDTMLRFIEIRKQHPERAAARFACVVEGDFAFGMLRMFELHSTGLPHKMMVFKNLVEAETWLQDEG